MAGYLLFGLTSLGSSACSWVLALDHLDKVDCADCEPKGGGREAGVPRASDTETGQSTTTPPTNGPPVLALVTPSSAIVGSPERALKIIGAGFVRGSIARASGHDLATIYVSATELSATLPAGHMASPRVLAMTVFNPLANGGVSSDSRTFTVGGSCDSVGTDLVLGAPGSVATRDLDFSTGIYAALLQPGTCPTTLDPDPWRSPYRTFVVQNTSSAAITLSAWAACTSSQNHSDDAILAFYRRNTPITTDSERLVCASSVAEGQDAPGAFSSPEANGSKVCPGLTRANGGAIRLASCEKAVVYVQAYGTYDSPYPPPRVLRLGVD